MAINTNLVSFYDLATGADSIGGYTLTAANGAAFSGTATLPNFNSSIYAATQIPLGGGDFSLSFWFKDLKSRASAAANFMVFGAYSNGGAAGAFGGTVAKYPIVIYTNDELGVWDGSFQSTGVQVTQASTGASWHLMNAVYDSTASTMTFYMDGSQVGLPISFNGMPSIQVFGSFTNFNYNASENMDDIAVWQRKITPTEIGQIYSAGQGNFSSLLPSLASLRGMFSSVVHTVAAENSKLHGMFTSVVHTVSAENSRLHGMFTSVVHNDVAAGGGGGDSQPFQGDSIQGQDIGIQGLKFTDIQGQ